MYTFDNPHSARIRLLGLIKITMLTYTLKFEFHYYSIDVIIARCAVRFLILLLISPVSRSKCDPYSYANKEAARVWLLSPCNCRNEKKSMDLAAGGGARANITSTLSSISFLAGGGR